MSSVELSPKEQEVLILKEEGKSAREIADALDVGVASVYAYISKARKKIALGAKIEKTSRKSKSVASKEDSKNTSAIIEDAFSILDKIDNKSKSFAEFKKMLDPIEVSGSLEVRVSLFKKAVCIACPHRNVKCSECPGSEFMKKFLY